MNEQLGAEAQITIGRERRSTILVTGKHGEFSLFDLRYKSGRFNFYITGGQEMLFVRSNVPIDETKRRDTVHTGNFSSINLHTNSSHPYITVSTPEKVEYKVTPGFDDSTDQITLNIESGDASDEVEAEKIDVRRGKPGLNDTVTALEDAYRRRSS